MDISKLSDAVPTAKTPTGKDPEIERLAEQYAKRDWTMTVEPLLLKVMAMEMQDDDFVAEMQQTLFEQKYQILENSQVKKSEAKATGKRW